MGAQLVGLVYAGYAHLPGSQFKVLGRMALSALDRPKGDQPARVYFGGWEALSMALGRDVPYLSGDAAELNRRIRVLRNEVIRTCTALRKVGAIEPLNDHPQANTRQAFLLTLAAIEARQIVMPDAHESSSQEAT